MRSPFGHPASPFVTARVLGLLLAGALLGACAGQPTAGPDEGAVAVDAPPPSDQERAAMLDELEPAPARLRRDHRSNRQVGRTYDVTVYTREDLSRTGHSSAAEALRALDPRFQ